MAATNFVNAVTLSDAGWFNDVDAAIYDDVKNVKNSAFGAVGDGTTDDTAAFNSAIAAGANIYVPAGTYLLTALTAFGTASKRIFGEGATSILKFNTAGVGISLTNGSPAQSVIVELRDLAFLHGASTPASFIKNNGVLNLRLSHLRFSSCTATWCIDNVLGYGLKVRDSVFSDVTGGGIILRDDGGSTKYSYVTTIDGCDFTRLSGKGIEAEGTWGLKLSNTVLESCTGVAVDVATQGSASVHALNIVFDGVHFETNTTTDVNLRSSGTTYSCNATFTGCSFVSGAGCTVALGNASQATFIGCKTLSGTAVTVSGSSIASATFIDSPVTASGSGFVRSGTFPWRDLSSAIPLQFSWTGGLITDVLGINVNAATGGRTALALISTNTSTGNLTASAVYMIRFGYDADNFTATAIARDDGGAAAGAATYTFAVAAGGQLRVTAPTPGNHKMTLFTNNFWYSN